MIGGAGPDDDDDDEDGGTVSPVPGAGAPRVGSVVGGCVGCLLELREASVGGGASSCSSCRYMYNNTGEESFIEGGIEGTANERQLFRIL